MNPEEHITLMRAAGIKNADEVIAALGGIEQVAGACAADLQRAGVPRRTAEKLTAAFAIGRIAGSRASERITLSLPVDIFDIMRPLCGYAQQESFWVLSMNVRNGLIDKPTMVALGTVHGVEVHPREVFRPAIQRGAAGIIVCHNHPSGDPAPSTEDVFLTLRLKQVGELVGIPLVDHVVIAATGFRSIAEHMGSEF